MVKVNRVRRIIRKIDPWTVLKVTFVLNFIVALTMVLGFSILWVLLVNAGVPQGLEDIARRLALLDADASLVGNVEPLFSSVVFLATVYVINSELRLLEVFCIEEMVLCVVAIFAPARASRHAFDHTRSCPTICRRL